MAQTMGDEARVTELKQELVELEERAEHLDRLRTNNISSIRSVLPIIDSFCLGLLHSQLKLSKNAAFTVERRQIFSVVGSTDFFRGRKHKVSECFQLHQSTES